LIRRNHLSAGNNDGPIIHIGSLSAESDDHYSENSINHNEERKQITEPNDREQHGNDDNIDLTAPEHSLDDENMMGDAIKVEDEFREDQRDERVRYPSINQAIPEVQESETEINKNSYIEESKRSMSSYNKTESFSEGELRDNEDLIPK